MPAPSSSDLSPAPDWPLRMLRLVRVTVTTVVMRITCPLALPSMMVVAALSPIRLRLLSMVR